jgi:hypothetical protein
MRSYKTESWARWYWKPKVHVTDMGVHLFVTLPGVCRQWHFTLWF